MSLVLRREAPFWRSPSFGAIAALHVAGLGALAHWEMQRPDSVLAQVLTVRLIEPERPKLVEPKPLPPPPKAVPRPALAAPPQPVMTAAAAAPAAPAALVVPPQPPAPPRVEPVAPPPAPPAPPALMPPRFDADYLQNPKPAYPAISRRLGEEGKTVLRVRVGADGAALEVEVKQGSGFPRLDAAARDAVAKWRFVPARRGSEAVESWVAVPIQFALES